MNSVFKKNAIGLCYILLFIIFLVGIWQAYIPRSWETTAPITFTIKKGSGYSEIAQDLKNQGIIKNAWFFSLYALASRNYNKLQAGNYEISPSISVAQIVKKFASGDVIKNTVTIVEGWDLKDIGQYLESKHVDTQKDFLVLAKKDYSKQFQFLSDKPAALNLEGYIFPDTYQLALDAAPETIINTALSNFDKKLTPELRQEITAQKKSVFQIITMASLIEKEVILQEDKKIVSGILWKRLENGMPLQVDATINYITEKNDSRTTREDTAIDSPYNTYKYAGLPLGPICNPGIESIVAAIYPTQSQYWYYLSAPDTGNTIFSKTLEEHNKAAATHLK